MVAKTEEIGDITHNGKKLVSFMDVPDNTNYAYRILEVKPGVHTVSSKGQGFNIYQYGINESESSFSTAGVYVGKKIEIFERNFPFFSFYFLNAEHEQFIDRMDSLYYNNTLEIAELMFFNDDLSMNISGFTSTPGDSLSNVELAWNRATVVKNKIMEQYRRLCKEHKRPYDFDPSRLNVASFGEDPEYLKEPKDDEEGDDEEAKEAKPAKNRRVEVVFILDE